MIHIIMRPTTWQAETPFSIGRLLTWQKTGGYFTTPPTHIVVIFVVVVFVVVVVFDVVVFFVVVVFCCCCFFAKCSHSINIIVHVFDPFSTHIFIGRNRAATDSSNHSTVQSGFARINRAWQNLKCSFYFFCFFMSSYLEKIILASKIC